MLNIYLGSSNATKEYTSLKINQNLKHIGAKVTTWNKGTPYDSELPLKSDFLLLIMPDSSFVNGPHFSIGKGQYDQMISFRDAGRQDQVLIATYQAGAEKFKVLTIDWKSVKVVNSTTWGVGHAHFKIRAGEDMKIWHDNEVKQKALREDTLDLDFDSVFEQGSKKLDEWRALRDKQVAESNEKKRANATLLLNKQLEAYRTHGIVITIDPNEGKDMIAKAIKQYEQDEDLAAAMFLGVI